MLQTVTNKKKQALFAVKFLVRRRRLVRVFESRPSATGRSSPFIVVMWIRKGKAGLPKIGLAPSYEPAMNVYRMAEKLAGYKRNITVMRTTRPQTCFEKRKRRQRRKE
uniref:Uncharacterized protein n=1 Tax=Romanomermis culicivorax TaxID=13658 RepID=A0A915K2I0_ROMCU